MIRLFLAFTGRIYDFDSIYYFTPMFLQKYFTLIAVSFVSFINNPLLGQSTNEEAAVMKPIHLLFEGMRKTDSAMVSKAFMPESSFLVIGTGEDGTSRLIKSELKQFLIAMGTPRKAVYSEPIWDIKIELDGNLAQVWAKYAFYIDKQLHHCGVDTFQLLKNKNEWRIFHLAYSRQDKGCIIPQEIQDQYK